MAQLGRLYCSSHLWAHFWWPSGIFGKNRLLNLQKLVLKLFVSIICIGCTDVRMYIYICVSMYVCNMKAYMNVWVCKNERKALKRMQNNWNSYTLLVWVYHIIVTLKNNFTYAPTIIPTSMFLTNCIQIIWLHKTYAAKSFIKAVTKKQCK